MMTFAYLRVSTDDQDNTTQLEEIKAAGFEPSMTFADHGVSGSVQASQRPEFRTMLETIRRTSGPSRVVVTKLDRLGRDAIDIMQTVRSLAEMGSGVVVLQLGALDLTSSAGKLTLNVLASVAEMERDLIRERTQAGLKRAKAQGRKLGRPSKLSPEDREEVLDRLASGASVSSLARDFGVSRATIINVRGSAEAAPI